MTTDSHRLMAYDGVDLLTMKAEESVAVAGYQVGLSHFWLQHGIHSSRRHMRGRSIS